MQQLSTPELIQACSAENAQYRQGQASEGVHSLELFRRAIVGGDQLAWEAIYQQYWRLMARWVNGAIDQVHDRVQAAYLKFLHAVPSPTFENKFATIGHLMAFLKRCAYAVRIDDHRAQLRQELYGPPASWEYLSESRAQPGEPALERLARRELMEYIQGQMHGEQEQVVLRLTLLGCTPRQIAEKAPAIFPDAAEVYKIKERVLLRLSNDPRLADWRPGQLGK